MVLHNTDGSAMEAAMGEVAARAQADGGGDLSAQVRSASSLCDQVTLCTVVQTMRGKLVH